MEALGLDLLHFWLIGTVCLAAGIISNFWHSAAYYRMACLTLGRALDEATAEIIRLRALIDEA